MSVSCEYWDDRKEPNFAVMAGGGEGGLKTTENKIHWPRWSAPSRWPDVVEMSRIGAMAGLQARVGHIAGQQASDAQTQAL